VDDSDDEGHSSDDSSDEGSGKNISKDNNKSSEGDSAEDRICVRDVDVSDHEGHGSEISIPVYGPDGSSFATCPCGCKKIAPASIWYFRLTTCDTGQDNPQDWLDTFLRAENRMYFRDVDVLEDQGHGSDEGSDKGSDKESGKDCDESSEGDSSDPFSRNYREPVSSRRRHLDACRRESMHDKWGRSEYVHGKLVQEQMHEELEQEQKEAHQAKIN